MSRIRGFECTQKYRDCGLSLPARSTKNSAGYDISAAEKVCLKPGELILIPTGMKAYMQSDEYLGIHIRSSLAVKHKLHLANSQGIIDSDYYDNPDNEGHILVAVVNGGIHEFIINKGTRIAQGIFCRYLLADQDGTSLKESRAGGIGSTGV